ncbi:uncharacterized protein LOC130961932 isoform X2 [Arachis stenosperma]|uniref:uncharacterized protein LOC130961932 isoform X2 n=1 Tax=Arachis stenosperma TaxID=217475 RepID=UPI0025AD8861|nr:uncharacterized protein LOC130961932 isoform X2 [Arachis stenosperma]
MASCCSRRGREMRERGGADSDTATTPCSTSSLPLFRHERRTREEGNKTAKELSNGERRRASDLLPPVRPADPSPNCVASVKLSPSPLPEVAIGAATPLLSFFFSQVNFYGFACQKLRLMLSHWSFWTLSELLPVKFRWLLGRSFIPELETEFACCD